MTGGNPYLSVLADAFAQAAPVYVWLPCIPRTINHLLRL